MAQRYSKCSVTSAAITWNGFGIRHRLGQPEAVDGGQEDPTQVRIVGLDAGMRGLTESLAGQGMNGAALEAGGGEGPL
jgi:hypothetical protein